MFGPDINRLNVYAQNTSSSSGLGKPIFQKLSNKGDKWLLGHVFVENRPYEDIRFVIEAIVSISTTF